MRKIERTGQFRRDYKREARGQHRASLDAGRDCHVKPDLVLIYQKPNADTLRLVRLGSHSELGL